MSAGYEGVGCAGNNGVQSMAIRKSAMARNNQLISQASKVSLMACHVAIMA